MTTSVDRGPAAELDVFVGRLRELEERSEGPIMTSSLDLRPDGSGSPVVSRIARAALREADPGSAGGDLELLSEALVEAATSAASAGHRGIFLGGPMDDIAQVVHAVEVPPRNRIVIGPLASSFEMERYRSLVRVPVAAVWADRSGMRWARTGGEAASRHGRLDVDDHYMRGALGRTGQHDRGGAAGMPSGGHSKTRVEDSAEEERERYARRAAEELDRDLAGIDVLVLSGPPEFAARLRAHLPGPLIDRIDQDHTWDGGPEHDGPLDEDALMGVALRRSVRAQYQRAADLARDVGSGAFGDRGTIGHKGVEAAVAEGRLAELVLHEDAAGHFGDAADARKHDPVEDAERLETLLLTARGQGAVCWFTDLHPPEFDPAQVVGTLRW
jgi:hypothetical protein